MLSHFELKQGRYRIISLCFQTYLHYLYETHRSNSSASNRGKRKKIPTSKSASNLVQIGHSNGPPTTPEPDYSCTDSDVDSEAEQRDITGLAGRLSSVQLQPVENSGNSNTRFEISFI